MKRFDYQADASQLAFLKLLSSKAEQKLKISCQNMPVVNNVHNSKPIMLFTDNDKRLLFDDPLFNYNVLSDNCQYGKNSLAETELEVVSRSQRLPIRDIAVSRVESTQEQLFGLQIGSVCFS